MNKAKLNKYFKKFGFEVHGTGFIQSLKKTDFKEDVFEKQKTIIGGKARTIFDVGANRGDLANKYSSLFPDAKIFAFEPFDASHDILVARTQHNPNIISFKKAVSSETGFTDFFVNKNVDTNSLLPSKKMGLSSDEQVKNVTKVTVEKLTIDSFCTENNIADIDILKLDIQGGELMALKGAVNLLRAGKIKLIYSETYFSQQYENQPLFPEIAQFLYGYGYTTQDFYNPIYGNNKIGWCDTIFTR